MNKDLEWLARNVHEWANDRSDIIGLDNDGEVRFYGVDCVSDYYADHSLGPFDFGQGVGQRYTRSEWQTVRDELSGKPSWSCAPKWAEWLAQCAQGYWVFFSSKPLADTCTWDQGFASGYYGDHGEVLVDWRDTLEKRPSDEPSDKTRRAIGEANNMTTEKQWRGPEDGLPPVGEWVQFKQIDETGANLNGLECYVISNGKDNAGVDVTTAYFNKYGYQAFASDCFRPIRTKEEKVVGEMLSLDCEPHEGMLSRADFCRKLYREGYRKQEHPE